MFSRVTGQIMPGLPRSTIRAGRRADVDVMSKSSAFGAPTLWRKPLTDNQAVFETVSASRKHPCDMRIRVRLAEQHSNPSLK